MAIQIEIVGRDAVSATVAFYYSVPAGQREAFADDASREPAGGANTRLSAAEITDLKSGALFELVKSFSIIGFTAAQMRTRLEAAWTELQLEALAEYKSRYQHLHIAFDGVDWI